MNTMKDILENPIIQEIRDNWEIYAQHFNHDLTSIYEDLKAKEKKWTLLGFEFVEPDNKLKQVLETKLEPEN